MPSGQPWIQRELRTKQRDIIPENICKRVWCPPPILNVDRGGLFNEQLQHAGADQERHRPY